MKHHTGATKTRFIARAISVLRLITEEFWAMLRDEKMLGRLRQDDISISGKLIAKHNPVKRTENQKDPRHVILLITIPETSTGGKMLAAKY